MKILYVSDLDGTLLNDDSRISEKSLAILNDLIGKGVAFTFATARSIHSASIVSQGLHLQIPVIVYNGVYLLDPKDHHILYQQGFRKEEAQYILTTAQTFGCLPFVYAYVNGKERVSYCKEGLHAGGVHYIQSRPGDERFRCVDTPQQLQEGDAFYMTFIGTKENLQPFYEKMEDTREFTVTFQQERGREEYWLEFMPATASKANAIQKLKELGGYEYVVSFGDAINDLPMFQISDEAYAVANAIEELQQQATGIIGRNEEDGVALWMQQHA